MKLPKWIVFFIIIVGALLILGGLTLLIGYLYKTNHQLCNVVVFLIIISIIATSVIVALFDENDYF